MKKYTAVSTVINIAKAVAWFLYISGFISIIILLGVDEALFEYYAFMLVPLGLALLIFGFIIQTQAELIAIFRDVAINTQKTNELLENNVDKTVAKKVEKTKSNAFQERNLDDILDGGNKK
jgi:hypothetical protein